MRDAVSVRRRSRRCVDGRTATDASQVDSTLADGAVDAMPTDTNPVDSGCTACTDAGFDSAPVDSAVADASDVTTADAGVRGVTVMGVRLQRDGVDFLPHGFNMIGILTPDACRGAPGMGTTARNAFGMAELVAARDAWHANTLRLQVSQTGMDPTHANHSAAYETRVRNGVALARSLGFVVIVSMQDQSIGCGDATELPTAQTLRSWDNLAPMFRDDPYVMFEMYNEPQNQSNAAGWAEWRDGGRSPIDVGEAAIGHQAIVDHLRNTLNVTNVLIADGANYAGQLQGIPRLNDPLSRIAYAVHPYYFHTSNTATLATDTANWDTRFGYLTATAPLLATEWNASASCFTGQAARIADFFSYLTAHHIGLFGHAFDVVGKMPTNLTNWSPTMFTGCSAGSDAGELVQMYYATLPR